MKTLDRYIVRSFLWAALMWFLALMFLRIVTDLFINMDEFAEASQPIDALIRHVATYYAYQSAVYVMELGGVIIVAAAAFSLARMNHSNELTAMLASGVSLHRVVWPILLCAMLLGGLVVLDQELLVPRISHRLVRSRDEVPGQEQFPVRLVVDGSNSLWMAPKYRPGLETMDRPIVLLRDRDASAMGHIHGSSARPGKLGGSRGWLVSDATMRQLGPQGRAWPVPPRSDQVHTRVGPEEILRRAGEPADSPAAVADVRVEDNAYGMVLTAERLEPDPPQPGQDRTGALIRPRFAFPGPDGRTMGVFLARSARWLPGKADESAWILDGGALFYPTDLDGKDLQLRQSSRWLDFMSTRELTDLLRLQRLPDPQSAELTKHARATAPINNLVMLMLGLPFILSRERNIKASASLCLLVVMGFYAVIYLCRYVGLPPILATWAPALVFGPVAAVMLDSVKT